MAGGGASAVPQLELAAVQRLQCSAVVPAPVSLATSPPSRSAGHSSTQRWPSSNGHAWDGGVLWRRSGGWRGGVGRAPGGPDTLSRPTSAARNSASSKGTSRRYSRTSPPQLFRSASRCGRGWMGRPGGARGRPPSVWREGGHPPPIRFPGRTIQSWACFEGGEGPLRALPHGVCVVRREDDGVVGAAAALRTARTRPRSSAHKPAHQLPKKTHHTTRSGGLR